MNIEPLRYFLYLAETLHFGKTSTKFFISPATLSRHIQRLEEQTGTLLFDRHNRRVSLTPAGKAFCQFATQTLQQWDHLQQSWAHHPGELHGVLRLYCSVTASYTVLPHYLQQVRDSHPHIRFELETGDAELTVQKCRSGAADIGITAIPSPTPTGLLTQQLSQTPLVFFQSKHTSFTLKEGPFVLPITGLAKQLCLEWFQTNQQHPDIYTFVSGFEGIVSLVSVGCGIGIVPKIVLDHSPLNTQLRILKSQPKLPELPIGLCTLDKKKDSPLINAFWTCAT